MSGVPEKRSPAFSWSTARDDELMAVAPTLPVALIFTRTDCHSSYWQHGLHENVATHDARNVTTCSQSYAAKLFSTNMQQHQSQNNITSQNRPEKLSVKYYLRDFPLLLLSFDAGGDALVCFFRGFSSEQLRDLDDRFFLRGTDELRERSRRCFPSLAFSFSFSLSRSFTLSRGCSFVSVLRDFLLSGVGEDDESCRRFFFFSPGSVSTGFSLCLLFFDDDCD
jgi:hypothetical protein